MVIGCVYIGRVVNAVIHWFFVPSLRRKIDLGPLSQYDISKVENESRVVETVLLI